MQIFDGTILTDEGHWLSIPQIVQFQSSVYELVDDTPAIVEWVISSYSAEFIVSLNGNIVSATGQHSHWSAEVTQFQLTITYLGEIIQSSEIITIRINDKPPEILRFVSNKSYCVRGFPVTLAWEVINARNVIIDQLGAVAHEDLRSVTINDQGIFRLVATGNFGTRVSAEVAIMPIPTPMLTRLQIPNPALKVNISLSEVQIQRPVFGVKFEVQLSKLSQKPALIELNELYEQYKSRRLGQSAYKKIQRMFSAIKTLI